jgi:hypothetical protein
MVVVNNSDAAESVTVSVANTALEGCGSPEMLWGKSTGVAVEGGVMRVNVAARQAVAVGVR